MKRSLVFLLLCLLCSPLSAQPEPRAVVEEFYQSYMRQSSRPGNWLKALMTENSHKVEPQLRDLLVKLSEGEPGGDRPWLDFDPISNSQMGTESYHLGPSREKNGLIYIPVKIKYPGDPGPAQLAAHVIVRRTDGVYKIANFDYPARDGMEAWNLLRYLKDEFGVKP